jgi:hypothetical protein
MRHESLLARRLDPDEQGGSHLLNKVLRNYIYCSTKLEGAGRITSGTAKTVTVAIAETSASRSSTVPTASACTSM